MGTVAIFAGSFDPPTLGHADLISRAAGLFDELIVAVGNNPAKKYWFPLDKRRELVAASAPTGVRVIAFEGLLVHAAAREHANVILRGVRGPSDLEFEQRYAIANRQLTDIETVYLPSDPRFAHVSSSLVREITGNGGNADHYVGEAVREALAQR